LARSSSAVFGVKKGGRMKYHLITIACLLLAMACYGFFALGGAAIAFLVAAVAMVRISPMPVTDFT
jgi:hypothetical protein